jgi:hypothetical protein
MIALTGLYFTTIAVPSVSLAREVVRSPIQINDQGRHDDGQNTRGKSNRHRQAGKQRNIIVVPRKRIYRNVVVLRRHVNSYPGFGQHHNDNDAFKWLVFTAITLKLLDNINEEAQRAHEAAQVAATTAAIGEKITWENDSGSGYVVATKQGSGESGQTCREFQQVITVGGETENAYGTACLQADGAWKIIS